MTSALRLTAGLAGRAEASAEQISAAATPDQALQAHVQYLRSLAVLAAKADPEGTALIVKRAGEQVAAAAADMTALIQHQITQMSSKRSTS